MKYTSLTLILFALVTSIASCDGDDSDSTAEIEISNSIFYVTQHIDQFNNNDNFYSFYLYNTVTEKTLKVPIELRGNSLDFLLVGTTFYFIQNTVLKSLDLSTNKTKNLQVVPPGAIFSVSHNGNFLAYQDIHQIYIVDLTSNKNYDTLENEKIVNLRWSPTANQLLVASQPSLIYDADQKKIIASLENTSHQFEEWKNDGLSVFYKRYTGDATPYFVQEIANHSVTEIPTEEKMEIYDGHFSPNGHYFSYLHTPRNYLSNFHYFNTLTNEDVTIQGDSIIIADYDWFSEAANKILFASHFSLFIYNLSEKTLEKTVNAISDQHTYIIYVKNLE